MTTRYGIVGCGMMGQEHIRNNRIAGRGRGFRLC